MHTDQLIKVLAADGGAPRVDLRSRLAAATGVGIAISAIIFVVAMGPRPDIGSVLGEDPRFALKFVVTLALAASAAGLVFRLLRPGAVPGWWWLALLMAPFLLAAGVVYEIATIDAALWRPRMIGSNSVVCLIAVPGLALPVLVALMVAMRAGAPTRPALAGAVAGLIASGLGAALYAAHCTDDSPLFVAVWYGIAIAIVVAIGALIGARCLRW